MNAEFRWVVDPIDGTVNYFYGMPHAAVSIALEHRKKSIVAVIYDPFTDEIWTTTKGEPSRLNGKIVRVSNRSKIGEAVVAMGFSKRQGKLAKKFAASHPHFQARKKNPHPGFGCAGTCLRRQRTFGRLHRAHDQSCGMLRRAVCWWKMPAANFTRCPRRAENCGCAPTTVCCGKNFRSAAC